MNRAMVLLNFFMPHSGHTCTGTLWMENTERMAGMPYGPADFYVLTRQTITPVIVEILIKSLFYPTTGSKVG